MRVVNNHFPGQIMVLAKSARDNAVRGIPLASYSFLSHDPSL